MKEITEPVLILASRKRRIVAFLIDHFIFTFLFVALIFLILGPDFMSGENPARIPMLMALVMVPGFIIYFAKDSVKGISIGRWIMGIMVRDEKNPEVVPSPGRLFVRNLFMILWPVEFIILAKDDHKKRLGDKLAKTIVVKNPQKSNKFARIGVLVIFGLGFSLFMLLFGSSTFKNSEAYKTAIREIKLNPEVINKTGGIKGFGMMPSGKINITDGYGQATLTIKVLGNTNDLTLHTYLEKEPEGEWELKTVSE